MPSPDFHRGKWSTKIWRETCLCNIIVVWFTISRIFYLFSLFSKKFFWSHEMNRSIIIRRKTKIENAIIPMITNKPDMSILLLHISATDNNYLIVIFICLEKKMADNHFQVLISTSRIVSTNWNSANSLRILRKTSNCSKWFLILFM